LKLFQYVALLGMPHWGSVAWLQGLISFEIVTPRTAGLVAYFLSRL